MTGIANRYGIYEVDHTTFGGLVYASDFNTDYRRDNNNGSPIAQRIISDRNFDKKCRNNIKNIFQEGNKK